MRPRRPRSAMLARRAGALMAVLFLFGCLSPRKLQFTPPSVLPVIPAHLQATAHPVTIAMPRPVDARSDHDFGWGALSPQLPLPYKISTDDAATWLGNALASGLENAGYEIAPLQDTRAADAGYILKVELTELSCGNSGLLNYRSVVGATVELDRHHQEILKKSYRGEYIGPFRAPPDELLAAMSEFTNIAAEKLLEQAVPEIASAIVQSNTETQRLTSSGTNATQP